MRKMLPEAIPESPAALTVGEAARALTVRLRSAGLATPELDARVLLCEAATISHEQLLLEPGREMFADEQERLHGYGLRRLAREPVSRILGRREFRGRDFALSPATLDPRCDSETVIDAAVAIAKIGKAPLSILDLGTGTGCLLLSLLGEFPQATGLGIDISGEAIAVARNNAERLGFASRAFFQPGDWLDGLEGQFDLAVANPPYIPRGDIPGLELEVSRHDPLAALDGGADGLEAYRTIAAKLPGVLAPGGVVLLEVGAGQDGAVIDIAKRAGLEPYGGENGCWSDLGGRVRCVALARESVIQ